MDYGFQPEVYRTDSTGKVYCALLGLVALIVIMHLYQSNHAPHHIPQGNMVPVFVSSMKASVESAKNLLKSNMNTVQSKVTSSLKSVMNTAKQVSAMASAAESNAVNEVDSFTQIEDDDVFTNLTKCPKGALCASQDLSDDEKKSNDEKVKTYLVDHPDCVMMVFAPWCGHCKTAMPEFTAARKKTETPMAVVNSNMVSQNLLANELNVTHFPFIVRKMSQSMEVFKGKTESTVIAEFAKKNELQLMFS